MCPTKVRYLDNCRIFLLTKVNTLSILISNLLQVTVEEFYLTKTLLPQSVWCVLVSLLKQMTSFYFNNTYHDTFSLIGMETKITTTCFISYQLSIVVLTATKSLELNLGHLQVSCYNKGIWCWILSFSSKGKDLCKQLWNFKLTPYS